MALSKWLRLTGVVALIGAMYTTSLQDVAAEDWANKMFDKLEHDFGQVARFSKVEYRFQIKNLYKEDIKIASVRSSCGCATPSVSQNVLSTGETAELVAKYNTDRFRGKRGATITVRFAPPFAAEVRLRVDGYIRTDVVFNPNRIDIGTVNFGEGVEKTVKIIYQGGNLNWLISKVRTSNPHFVTSLTPTKRNGSRIEYDLHFKLNENAPAGYINDQILLVTNELSGTPLPLSVEGQVVATISVSPASLDFGVVAPGQSVTRQIVVRGQRPFQLAEVRCQSGVADCFAFQVGGTERTLHLVPVTFTAPDRAGKVEQRIEVVAEGMDGDFPSVVAHAEVRGP